MSGLLASWRKLSRRKQWLRAVRDRHPDDGVFLAVIASVFVIAVGGALSVLILGVWVVNSIDAGGERALAGTVHIFRPPPRPKPQLQAAAEAARNPAARAGPPLSRPALHCEVHGQLPERRTGVR